MSTSAPTSESLKAKAKIIRSFMKEKCNADISNSHSLELISQLSGFKDWNTATAMASKAKLKQESEPLEVRTVGELKLALEPFDNDAIIDADYDFDLAEYLESLYMEDFTEGKVTQEFSIAADKRADDIICRSLDLI